MVDDLFLPNRFTRRDFLRTTGSAAGLMLMGCMPARRGDSSVRLAAYPFTLGIASGDPHPDGVVLWTRLAPETLVRSGLTPGRVPVRWEIANDEAFSRIAASGEVLAIPELNHSVHVEATGLEPDRIYFYRFIVGGETSPVGRTRTAPAPGTRVDDLAFAFVSCQNYQAGHYTAYQHLVREEDLRLVVHLGDYIYEDGISERAIRQHDGPEIMTLEAYRNRYALYKSDAHLQAAHAAFPFVNTWDDHEVENNYAGGTSENVDPIETFLQRRAAAYQAYYENLPLRRASMPRGPDLQLYRRFRFGDLMELNMLDTRQHRSDQPCGDGVQAACSDADDPNATILGSAQEEWLLDGLGRSSARWNVLGNQLPIAPIDRRAGPEEAHHMDKWDGYTVQRDRVLGFMRDRRVANPIVLTGDVHTSWVCDLKASFSDPNSEVIGTEFVGTSLSSGGDGADTTEAGLAMLTENPHMKFYNAQRGYVRCSVTPERWTSDYKVVEYITRPNAPISTRASFVVENGRPGIQ